MESLTDEYGFEPSEEVDKPSWLSGSEEQETIWEYGVRDSGHLVVDAVAGSGKSTTQFEFAKRVKYHRPSTRIQYLAFAKSNQEDAQAKSLGTFTASTFHSFGNRALRDAKLKIGNDRVPNRMREVIDAMQLRLPKEMRASTIELANFARQTGATAGVQVDRLIDHHGLNFSDDAQEQEAVSIVMRALTRAKHPESYREGIDFTDMLWLPWALDLAVPSTDLLLVDEAQDLNRIQHWFVKEAKARTMIVGDPYQAIYGWRGADLGSMQRLVDEIDPQMPTYPLTFTRRCPTSHVEAARIVVPHITAMEGAAVGEIRKVDMAFYVMEAQPGDMTLCRLNAPLFDALNLFETEGRAAQVMGAREYEKGLAALLTASEKSTLAQTLHAARLWTDEKVEYFANRQKFARVGQLEENLNILIALAGHCADVNDLKDRIDALDEEQENPIKLGTVHKQKGREARNVWVLKGSMMPWPYAKAGTWQHKQEMNLLYVAMTRGLGDAVINFVDEVPGPLRVMLGESDE